MDKRDLTHEENQVLRNNPGIDLISEAIPTDSGHTIYFAIKYETGRIIMQLLNRFGKATFGPVFLNSAQVENQFPCILGDFLTSMRNHEKDPRLAHQNTLRAQATHDLAIANPKAEGE